MKKILLPTDFSDVANNAFVHALHLAKALESEIILLHTFEFPVIDNQFYTEDYMKLFESIELAQSDNFKREMENMNKIIKAENCETVKISHSLKDGDLLMNINEVCSNQNIDLIIMGTSGAEGWKLFFLGTNTTDVIAQSTIPVISIPKEATYSKYENIAFTTRFREKDKIALQKVIVIAKLLKVKVKCLYVQTENTDNSAKIYNDWKQLFANEPVQFFIIPDNDVDNTIADFITSQEIDLLAMLTYKRSFFEALFNKSLTKKMAFGSDIPVLALHE
jgi:nucleotide-binding universal stress UspA family protein